MRPFLQFLTRYVYDWSQRDRFHEKNLAPHGLYGVASNRHRCFVTVGPTLPYSSEHIASVFVCCRCISHLLVVCDDYRVVLLLLVGFSVKRWLNPDYSA